jgi:hypothetical protein
MLREATDPPAAVNVLDVSSESMAAFQVFTYGRFWVFTEAEHAYEQAHKSFLKVGNVSGNTFPVRRRPRRLMPWKQSLEHANSLDFPVR